MLGEVSTLTEVGADEAELSIAAQIEQIVEQLRPSAAYGCASEEAAYEAAADNFETAGQLLQETGNALYDCEQGGGGQRPSINVDKIKAETKSILNR